jgi:transcriptional regulator with XRE-family HTH domain
MNHARALKIIRATKELSQQELAQILDISKSLVSLIESGDRNMSEKVIERIIQKLEIPKELVLLLATENGMKIPTEDELPPAYAGGFLAQFKLRLP